MCWRYQNAQFQGNEQKKVDERYYERLIWKRAIDRTIIVRIQNNKVLRFISMIQVCNKSPEIVPQNISKGIKSSVFWFSIMLLVRIRKIPFIILLRTQYLVLNYNDEKFLITCHVRTDNLYLIIFCTYIRHFLICYCVVVFPLRIDQFQRNKWGSLCKKNDFIYHLAIVLVCASNGHENVKKWCITLLLLDRLQYSEISSPSLYYLKRIRNCRYIFKLIFQFAFYFIFLYKIKLNLS